MSQRERGWGQKQREARKNASSETMTKYAEDSNSVFKYKPPKKNPGAGPAPGKFAAKETPSKALKKGSSCMHATLVELFEHMSLTKLKPCGQLGAAIIKHADNSFSMVLYSPVSQVHEFQVVINPSFDLEIISSVQARFMDPDTKRYWSLKFTSDDDLKVFARHVAMTKDYILAVAYKKGGVRRVIVQGLSVGEEGAPTVNNGDQVKIKTNMYLTSESHPRGMGNKLVSNDVRRFVVGRDGGSVLPGVEQGILGMAKKTTRFLVIPPLLAEEASSWGPQCPPDSTLLVEVTVSSIKVNQKDLRRSMKVGGEKPKSEVKEPKEKKKSKKHRRKKSSSRSSTTDDREPPEHDEADKPTQIEDVPEEEEEEEEDDDDALFDDEPVKGEDMAAAQPPTPEAEPEATEDNSIKTRMRKLSQASSTGVPVMLQVAPNTSAAANLHPVVDEQPELEAAESVSELAQLLASLGLSQYNSNFDAEGVTLDELLMLDTSEITSMVPKIGHRKRLMTRIAEIKAQNNNASSPPPQQHQQVLAQPKPQQVAASLSPYPQMPSSLPSSPMPVEHAPSSDLFGSPAPSPVATPQPTQPASAASLFGEAPNYNDMFASYAKPSNNQAVSDAYAKGRDEAVALAKQRMEQIKKVATEKINSMQDEMMMQAKINLDKMEQFKSVAQQKFSVLQEELRQEKQRNENAREYVTNLKSQNQQMAAELAQKNGQTEMLQAKTAQFVAQTRARETEFRTRVAAMQAQHEQQKEETAKQAIQRLYERMCVAIGPNDLYHGAQVSDLLKQSIKAQFNSH